MCLAFFVSCIAFVTSCSTSRCKENSEDKGTLPTLGTNGKDMSYLSQVPVVEYLMAVKITMNKVTHVVVYILSNLIIYLLLRYSSYNQNTCNILI